MIYLEFEMCEERSHGCLSTTNEGRSLGARHSRQQEVTHLRREVNLKYNSTTHLITKQLGNRQAGVFAPGGWHTIVVHCIVEYLIRVPNRDLEKSCLSLVSIIIAVITHIGLSKLTADSGCPRR